MSLLVEALLCFVLLVFFVISIKRFWHFGKRHFGENSVAWFLSDIKKYYFRKDYITFDDESWLTVNQK